MTCRGENEHQPTKIHSLNYSEAHNNLLTNMFLPDVLLNPASICYSVLFLFSTVPPTVMIKIMEMKYRSDDSYTMLDPLYLNLNKTFLAECYAINAKSSNHF